MMRVAARPRKSIEYGKKSAVMPSLDVTARSAQHIFVRPEIAHHADGLHRQQHRERLPDLIVQPSLADLIEINRIRLAQNIAASRA